MNREVHDKSIVAVAILLSANLALPSHAQFVLPPFPAEPLVEMQDAFERLIEKIAPSVVSIEAQFGPDGMERAPATALGSGFAIRPDGMILTSEHVVGRAMSIHVVLSDGTRHRARRISGDPRSDLAVIRIEAENLRPLPLTGGSAIRRGHIVLAFGNPLGLAGDGQAIASFGLVSAVARPLPEWLGQDEDRYYGETIQTTAQIGPGYSGGPLVDIHGSVIGVLTAATHTRAAADSLAFAVPMSRRNRQIIEKLLAGQEIEYGYLGVQVRDMPPTRTADQLSTAQPSGGVLHQIYADGPADRAGLQAGDVILEVDGSRTQSADRLIQIVGGAGPGAEVHIRLRRDGQVRECDATLARRMPAPGAPSGPQRSSELSLYGATLSEVDAGAGGSLPQGALMVRRIESGSPADRAGLMPGDIIVRVDGQTLTFESAQSLAHISSDCLVGLANGGSVLIRRNKL